MTLFPVGIEVVFLAEPAKVGWLTNYEKNNEGKIALHVDWLGLREKKTGFWFDENDFAPHPDQWLNYHGVIRCTKNLTGQGNFFNEVNTHLKAQLTAQDKLIDIYKRKIMESLQFLAKSELMEEKKKELFLQSEALRGLRDLVMAGAPPIHTEPKNKMSSLFNRG